MHLLMIVSLVAAFGLIGIIALQVFVPVLEADAKECNNIISINTSKGICFHSWLGEEVRIDP